MKPGNASFLRQLRDALFLDLPWALDSAMRHSDFNTNRRYVLTPNRNGNYHWRWRAPVAMALPLAVVLIFALYGPTPDALCSVFVPPHTTGFLWALLAAVAGGSLWLVRQLYRGAKRRYSSRIRWLIRSKQRPSLRRAHFLFYLLVMLSGVVVLGPASAVMFALYHSATNPLTCSPVTTLAPSALVQLVVTFGLCAVALSAPKRLPRWMLWTPVCVFLSAFCVWLLWHGLAEPGSSEAHHLPYRTLYAALAATLFLAVFPAKLLVKWLLKDVAAMPVGTGASQVTFGAALARALYRCDLFVKRSDPQFGWMRIGYALLSAPLLHPLMLLLIPSYTAIITDHDNLTTWFVITLALAWMLLALGSVSSRWNQQIVLVHQWLLRGLPLGVSVLVIALALCRLAGIEYVSYVMDAASFGALTMIILMCYALAWAIEGCLHRPLQVQLLMLLSPAAARRLDSLARGRVGYTMNPAHITTDVTTARRWLQPHGDGRFVVVARSSRSNDKQFFNTYGELELFERLVSNEQAHLSAAEHADLSDRLHELRRRLHLYSLLSAVLAVGAIAAFFACAVQADRALTRDPVVRALATPATAPAYSLLGDLQQHADQPALLVAASGGGTRAALFTTAALHGLAQAGLADHIRLMSGVSGGGVSLAYFAAHRDQLLGMNDDWQSYFNAMKYNHIGQVLEGSGEWQLLRHQSLAHLLVASFQRQFALAGEADSLGRVAKVGLILNTTITGHPYRDSLWLRRLFEVQTPQGPQPARPFAGGADALHMEFSRMAGGRLMFTNLREISQFPGQHPHADDRDFAGDFDLTYQIVRDPAVAITAAAALNANFPPVFANSGVWLDADAAHRNDPQKYYVTDGGINENRGLVSLLYALDSALAAQQATPVQQRKALPDINIAVLEASATGFDYSQDRGLGAALSSGAKERLASGLERTLLTAIRSRAQQLNDECHAAGASVGHCGPAVRIHYLLMPALLVTRGGLGTHWLLPETVRLSDPRDPRAEPAAKPVELQQDETLTLIQCLFASGADTPRCQTVVNKLPADWLQGADTEACVEGNANTGWCTAGWRELLTALGHDPPVP